MRLSILMLNDMQYTEFDF